MSFFKSNWDDDYVERTLENICPKEKRYMPDRICGDIPFIQYRSMFATPEKYLRFLKELEKSTSRHDFLFWLFDIITAGQEKERWHISAKDLDAQVRDRVPYIQNILSYAASMDKFSEYMFQEYSKIVKNPNEMDIFNPMLRTFPNTPKIFEYRKNALENSDKSKFFDDYSVEYININPMKNLTISDLPETPPELSFEEFIKEKAENQSFFALYNHFTNLLIYNMHIPDTNTCIFVDKDPYKILQVESYMLRIKVEKLVPINIIKAQELFKKDSIVVVVNDVIPEITNSTDVDAEDSDFNMQKSIFKRAKLLCNIPSPSPNKICLHLIDYGEISTVSMQEIFAYNFDTNAPKCLTTIVPQNKLSKMPKVDDMFVFDINKMKYVFVGRKSDSFNPAPNPLDELDTDTESIYFGSGASGDWENEENSDDEIDLNNDENCIIPKNNVISINIPNTESESEFELEFNDDENEECDSSEEDEGIVRK